MVIANFNFARATLSPLEAYTILVVNPNRILTVTLAFQQFGPISGWNTQVVQCFSYIQLCELSERDALECFKPWNAFQICEFFGIFFSIGLYHMDIITLRVNNVKR